MYEYIAVVWKVVDGDTMHLNLDLGCDVSMRMTVRLAGLNTPEMSTDEGVAAKDFVNEWLSYHAAGGKVRVLTIKDRKEKYGRYLANIWSVDLKHCLNTDLLKNGHAAPMALTAQEGAYVEVSAED